jgi:hypothetical protein
MAADDDVGAALNAWAQFRRSGNIEDRRDEPPEDADLVRANATPKSLRPAPNPSALASYISDLIIPPTKLATDLGYNDVHAPTKREMEDFNMIVNDADQDAINYWNEDPIGALLRRLPAKFTEAK